MLSGDVPVSNCFMSTTNESSPNHTGVMAFACPGARGEWVVGTGILARVWTAGEDTVRGVLSALFLLRAILKCRPSDKLSLRHSPKSRREMFHNQEIKLSLCIGVNRLVTSLNGSASRTSFFTPSKYFPGHPPHAANAFGIPSDYAGVFSSGGESTVTSFHLTFSEVPVSVASPPFIAPYFSSGASKIRGMDS